MKIELVNLEKSINDSIELLPEWRKDFSDTLDQRIKNLTYQKVVLDSILASTLKVENINEGRARIEKYKSVVHELDSLSKENAKIGLKHVIEYQIKINKFKASIDSIELELKKY